MNIKRDPAIERNGERQFQAERTETITNPYESYVLGLFERYKG